MTIDPEILRRLPPGERLGGPAETVGDPFETCPICGGQVDKRDLGDVARHLDPDHERPPTQ